MLGEYLTFAFDVDFDGVEYIPAGTRVKVYEGTQGLRGSTRVIYKGWVYAFADCSFVELR